MSRDTLEPVFIDGQRGKLFALLRRPKVAGPRACVLMVPPFAEEMNKSRKMLTDVALALAERGVASLLPDLFGTGDSEGEFREADFEVWKDDLRRAAAWVEDRGLELDGLLCVRFGCVLASEAISTLARPLRRAVFWQPVLDGERFMTQFLRLRVAASMMEDRKETVAGLRERARSGETVEVAGYELSSTLIGQIDARRPSQFRWGTFPSLNWMEVVRTPDAVLPVPSRQAMDAARGASVSVTAHAIVGEPFWSATEIVRIPGLVSATVDAFSSRA